MEAHRSSRPPRGGERSTWIAFVGVMMIIIAALDVMWGIAAIANNEVVVVGGHGVIVLDITTWGWIQLILAVILGLTGFGLLVGNELARMVAIGLLAINAVVQVVWFTAAPLWAILIIVLDVVLIYQLFVNWAEEHP
jgi:hypothetical protein